MFSIPANMEFDIASIYLCCRRDGWGLCVWRVHKEYMIYYVNYNQYNLIEILLLRYCSEVELSVLIEM